MADKFREWWDKGRIAALARTCRTAGDMAKALGVTADGLGSGLRRIGAPSPSALIRAAWTENKTPPVETEGGGHHRVTSWARPADSVAPDDEGVPPGGFRVSSRAAAEALLSHVNDAAPTEALRNLMRDDDDGIPIYVEAETTEPAQAPAIEPVEEHRLKRRLRELEAERKGLIDRVVTLEDQLDIIAGARQMHIDPIVPRERAGGEKHEATAVFLISDLHLEEEVRPEKVLGLNRFNLEIARLRMRRLAERMRWFIDRSREDFYIRDICVWFGGDSFTGHLHPDNIESTLLAPPAAFAFAKELQTDVLRFVLEDPEIERCVVPCNDGNHSRLTKDLRASTRSDHSLETLMYGMVAQDFADDPRVQFEIAQADRLYTNIYDLCVRWTHGAEVRGGSGIGGIMIPLYRAMSRWETERHADLTCVGHFHTRISLRDLEMNGSLIGFSPYAMRIGARFEEPTQSAFLIDPHRGKGLSAPLWASSPKEEAALWESHVAARQAA